jgi:Dyp-type peroxidase family
MIFGADQEGVATENYYKRLQEQYAPGLRELRYSFTQDPIYLEGVTLEGNREHFGFRDGISQPIIKGSGRTGPAVDQINAGEFLMGYKNEYGVYPDTPVISEDQGNLNLLAADAGGTGHKDLGKNGSYMVLRQLEQHVNTFWTFMKEQTKNADGSTNIEESDKLAAKMMGRWRCGAPISKFPDENPDPNDREHKYENDNDYNYKDDKEGLKCPFGSHMRRTNPRDTFEDDGPKQSVKLSNRHRIMRRARLYGEPHLAGPKKHEPNGEVGLIFTCFNADIARQFEFIQYTWGNYPKVKQLYNDPDPIIGVREKPEPGVEQNFTIHDNPVNKYITDLPSFVTVRGGAYFFFPSITSIRYLTTI